MIEDSARKILDKHLIVLKNEGINISQLVKREYNFEASLISGKETLKLLVFFGKKGIKTILQGNKESDIYKKVSSLLFGEDLFPVEKIVEPDSYIGIDESGKGDYFGPLVIAGVFINKDVKTEILKTGVRDSKQLSDNRIRIVAAHLRESLTVKNYNVVTINPEKYNQLYEKIGNVNKLLAWGHARVLENLLANIKTADAISDKFGNENFIISSLMAEGKKINLIQTHKGERFTAVAAASVLAREKFIEWFEKQEKDFKIFLPKGASSLAENAAKSLVKKNDDKYLTKFAKLHFKTTKKILSE